MVTMVISIIKVKKHLSAREREGGGEGREKEKERG